MLPLGFLQAPRKSDLDSWKCPNHVITSSRDAQEPQNIFFHKLTLWKKRLKNGGCIFFEHNIKYNLNVTKMHKLKSSEWRWNKSFRWGCDALFHSCFFHNGSFRFCIMWRYHYTVWPLQKSDSKAGALPGGWTRTGSTMEVLVFTLLAQELGASWLAC